MRSVKLNDIDLTRANLQSARLEGIDFSRAILREARMHCVMMSDADLEGTMRGVNLRGANLEGSEGTPYRRNTIIPDEEIVTDNWLPEWF